MLHAAARARCSLTLALAAAAIVAVSGAASAQSPYREYDDGPGATPGETWSDDEIDEGPMLRERAPRDDFGEEEDERFVPDDGAGGDIDEPYDFDEERMPERRGSLKDGDVEDVTYFYEELESDGRWFQHEDYGYVWRPLRIDAEWRPYTRGRWALTDDYGWFWVSDEPFGWATYHYGRWFHDRRHGWVWVPGTRWGPAWVAWRDSDAFVGWAPLPPDARWDDRRRSVVFHDDLYESPAFAIYWSFLAPAYFTVADPWRYYAPRHRVPYLVRHSRPHTHYAWRNRTIYNRGIAVDRIERATRRPVPRHQAAFSPVRTPRARAVPSGGRIEIYRPDLTRRTMIERRRGRDVPGAAPGARRAWRDVDRRVARPMPEARERRHLNRERRDPWGQPRRAPGAEPLPGRAPAFGRDATGPRTFDRAGEPERRNERRASRANERASPGAEQGNRGRKAADEKSGRANDGRKAWRPDLGKKAPQASRRPEPEPAQRRSEERRRDDGRRDGDRRDDGRNLPQPL